MLSDKKSKKELLKQITNYALVVGFGLTVIFLVTMVIKINGGIAKTVDTPDTMIRLQVTGNDPQPEHYGQLIDSLENYADSEIEIKLVDSETFDLRPLAQTMIISRIPDKAPATKLAELLGLDPDDIVYKPLENNFDQISVTLVVGNDLDKLTFINNEPMEN